MTNGRTKHSGNDAERVPLLNHEAAHFHALIIGKFPPMMLCSLSVVLAAGGIYVSSILGGCDPLKVACFVIFSVVVLVMNHAFAERIRNEGLGYDSVNTNGASIEPVRKIKVKISIGAGEGDEVPPFSAALNGGHNALIAYPVLLTSSFNKFPFHIPAY